MKCKGDNIFREGAKGGIAYGIRKEFKYTGEGNKRIDICFVAFDGDSNDNDNAILSKHGRDIAEIQIKYSLD